MEDNNVSVNGNDKRIARSIIIGAWLRVLLIFPFALSFVLFMLCFVLAFLTGRIFSVELDIIPRLYTQALQLDEELVLVLSMIYFSVAISLFFAVRFGQGAKTIVKYTKFSRRLLFVVSIGSLFLTSMADSEQMTAILSLLSLICFMMVLLYFNRALYSASSYIFAFKHKAKTSTSSEK